MFYILSLFCGALLLNNLWVAKVQAGPGCKGGEFASADLKSCFSCPSGYSHDAVKVVKGGSNASNKVCYKTKRGQKRKANYVYNTGSVFKPCKGGTFANVGDTKCYTCPGGFKHNPAKRVQDLGVCYTKNSKQYVNAIYKRPFAAEVKAAVRQGTQAIQSGVTKLGQGIANTGECGARNQRPCLLTERIPSCNRGLVEDFKYRTCLLSEESSAKEFEAFANRFLIDNKKLIDALVSFSMTLSGGSTPQYFSSGDFLKDVKSRRFQQIESRLGVKQLRTRLGKISSPLMPRAVTIGVVADGGVGIGGNLEQGVAINLTGQGPLADMYRTFGVSMGLITGGSGSVAVAFWRDNPTGLKGESRGLSFGGGKVVNPATGISVGGGIGFWFAPLEAFPGAIGFDYRQLNGISVAVGAGASVLPVDLRGTSSLTQLWDAASLRWAADSCGKRNKRPCHLVERVPSCDRSLREDFMAHQCVR